MRTVREPVEGEWVRIEPSREPGISVNDVPATLEHVRKADVRVDLYGEAGRSFVVEHVLGPLGLAGVTAATVTGTATEWDFARPEHRFCYSRGDSPAQVVGHPAGLPNPAIVKRIKEVGVREVASPTRQTVSEPVTFEEGPGTVTLRPRDSGAGVRFEVEFRGQTFVAEVDPAGNTDPQLARAVTHSTTPYLTESPREGIVHTVGDLVSDIPVLGGFTDLIVEANLKDAYHTVTVGASQKAHAMDVVVQS